MKWKMTAILMLFCFTLAAGTSYGKEYSFPPFKFAFEKVDKPIANSTSQDILVRLPEKVRSVLKASFPEFRLPQTKDIQPDSEWAADLSAKPARIPFFATSPTTRDGFALFLVSNDGKAWTSVFLKEEKKGQLSAYPIEKIDAKTPDVFATYANGSWSYGREGTDQSVLSIKDGKVVLTPESE